MKSIVLAVLSLMTVAAFAADPGAPISDAAQRGYKNLTEKAYVPASWTRAAYDNAWKRWPGVTTQPKDYDAEFRKHYGLHTAPFSNNSLPMGLKKASPLFGRTIAVDCLICHGGSIMGKSYIGLGNSTLDMQSLFEDMLAADGFPPRLPFTFTQVRGTTEAGAMAVYLLGRRNPDLSIRHKPVMLDLHDDLCEDPPAWWLLKFKKTMYWNGGADQRSVRSIMQFMMSPLTPASSFHESEADFADIRECLLSIEAPKYPFPIDHEMAARGEKLFVRNCSRCHGTYGLDGRYPNKIIPIEEIGTDRRRYDGITEKFGSYYDQSWFAKEKTGWLAEGYPAIPSRGYQAPPLIGIWASAPYFHNGSVPTIAGVLDSGRRPTRYTRSFGTELADYDPVNIGWKVSPITDPGVAGTPHDRRRVYDTTKPGRGNSGHFYGDALTDVDRKEIIEFLKTL